MKQAKTLGEELEETSKEADIIIRIQYDSFTTGKRFAAEPEQTKQFFTELAKRFGIHDPEKDTITSMALHVARNLLINAGTVNLGYSKWLAHPCFLDDVDTVIFYRCLALLKIEGWEPNIVNR